MERTDNTKRMNIITTNMLGEIVRNLEHVGITEFKKEFGIGSNWISGVAKLKGVDIEVAVDEWTPKTYRVRLAYKNNNFYARTVDDNLRLNDQEAEVISSCLVNVMYDKKAKGQDVLVKHMYDETTYKKLVKNREKNKCPKKASRKKTAK